MAEVQRDPVKIVVGDTEYVAFDEDHSINDIMRYLTTCGDAEAMIYFVDQLRETASA